MDSQKKYKGVIALLIVIVVILSLLCVLFATGTISLKANDVGNNDNNQNVIDNNENINESNSDNDVQINNIKVEDIKKIFEVAYNYYEVSGVYCGNSDHKLVTIYGTERYASTEFTTYDEMLNSLKKYMNLEVIVGKTPWAATTREYYLEQDGKLYCEETYKGYIYKQGNIEVEITSQTENKVNCVATMELTDPTENKTYDKVNLVLEEIDGVWIITSYKK